MNSDKKIDKDLVEKVRKAWYGDDHSDVEVIIRNIASAMQEVRDEKKKEGECCEICLGMHNFYMNKERTLSDRLVKALELIDEVWERANLYPDVNFLGDDEHEAWGKTKQVLKIYRKAREGRNDFN